MDEVLNQGEVQEVVQTETASPQDQSAQETNQEGQTNQTPSSTDHQDKSWIKKVRRDRDDAIRQADDARRQLKIQEELIKQLMGNLPQNQVSNEEDLLDQIQKEEYVPGDKVAKALRKQQQQFDQKLEEIKKASEQQKASSMFSELRREYSDFDDVVNSETLALLDETYPRLAQTIAKNKDPYDAALLAYETIKDKGLLEKVPGSRREKEVEKRLEQNKKTVTSPQAFDKRPMAQAFRYPETKKEKEALWNETLKYASMAGGGY